MNTSHAIEGEPVESPQPPVAERRAAAMFDLTGRVALLARDPGIARVVGAES